MTHPSGDSHPSQPALNRTHCLIFVVLASILLACLGSPVLVESQIRPTVTTNQPPPSFTPTPNPHIPGVWIDPELPELIRSGIDLPNGYAQVSDGKADYRFSVTTSDGLVAWVYALAEPFFQIRDSVSYTTLQQTWNGESTSYQILILQADARLWQKIWGEPSPTQVIILDSASDPDEFLTDQDILFLLPFEKLTPRWKVLQIDGVSPLDPEFDPSGYPLSLLFGFTGREETPMDLTVQPGLPISNRNGAKMTTVVMTGTTALTRAIGYKMDQNGVPYPAEKIRAWLRSADITHISNEVSFTPACPPADYDQESMVFCSRPEYIELLEDVGADVIELTGNHNLDWGPKPYLYSLDLYPEYNMRVYAGGKNIQGARQPLLLEDHGNKIAFLGCNYAGPGNAIASEDTPGSAFCNYDYFEQAIRKLQAEGYLTIMTLQHYEYYHLKLSERQIANFRQMADAGASIVQGSQAHFPQPMEFYGDAFIHYGLGNLFFDQMDIPVKGTRREFIDRYTIYDGKLISVELLTAMLEDYSQPRPMTLAERKEFLEEIFQASGALP